MIRPSSADYKEDLNRYVARATTIIHSPESRDKILAMLGGSDPVQSVANAAVMILQRIDAASREAGIEVQDFVKAAAAGEVVNLLVELGTAAKKLELDKDLVELALAVAVENYVKAEIKSGRMNAKAVQVAVQSDMRKMHPSQRKEVQRSQERIAQTARRYNGGKGQPPPPEQEEAAPQQGGGMLGGMMNQGMMQGGGQ